MLNRCLLTTLVSLAATVAACGEDEVPEVVNSIPDVEVMQAPQPPNTAQPPAAPAPDAQPPSYVVKEGDFLIQIGKSNGVSWQEIMILNEQFLKEKYEDICSKRKARRWYCNDAQARPYGNTLWPSWTLRLPSKVVPKTISEAVSAIVGKNIAIVIDDSGSMNDDRAAVAALYTSAIREQGRTIAGVWLYADGSVRHYTETAAVEFYTAGKYENTWGALQEAAKSKPDAIILVTDEPGNDWPLGNPASITRGTIPPVVAHCLPNHHGLRTCERTLRALVGAVGGSYIAE